MTSAVLHGVALSGRSNSDLFARMSLNDLHVNVPPFADTAPFPQAAAQELQREPTTGSYDMKGLPLWWTLLNMASRNCRG